MFQNIKGFEWKDLSGRTVRIQANESSDDGLVVIARDIETNEIYLVQSDITEEN